MAIPLRRSILGVEVSRISFDLIRYIVESNDSRFGLDGHARNVSEAVDEIDSGKYWGVLLNSLILPLNRSLQYKEKLKKFERWNTPFIMRSGGLYVIEYAQSKGLVSVVSPCNESRGVLNKAENLGARIVSKERDRMKDILRLFREAAAEISI